MSNRRQPKPVRLWQVLICGAVVGGGYAVRLGREHFVRQPSRAAIASLPAPERRSHAGPGEGRLPQEIGTYRLVSVVPETPVHDLHALYAAQRPLSLFKRRLDLVEAQVKEEALGPEWSPIEPVSGYPAFVSTRREHPALAWISDGKRHIVMGDVPVSELREFAVGYEKHPRKSTARSFH